MGRTSRGVSSTVSNGQRRRASTPGRWIPLVVVLSIAAFVVLPVLRVTRDNGADVAPVTLPDQLQPVRISQADTFPAEASQRVRALILYDVSGRWGALGELYATMTANLVGHFGRWTAKPASEYDRGDVERFTALIYIGSTYEERLPKAFLDDVLRTTRPVLWVGNNVAQLERRAGDFRARYGWQSHVFDRSPVAHVRYKGRTLSRWTANEAGIMRYASLDRSRVRVLARAERTSGSRFPWALRSRNLTYVGEVPFQYTSETDRVLVFADLLFDALAPRTRERHRALVRLEDINPLSDPRQLRAAADYLHRKGIPFGFGVSPYYRDPQGREEGPDDVRLRDAPEVVAALQYLARKGGVLVGHGFTHQWDGASNPYNGVTGDDVEFYRVTESPDGEVQQLGPLPSDDTVAWAESRIVAANREFVSAGLRPPRIFEFPHYAASDRAYRAAARRFTTRWERSLYFGGLLSGGLTSYRHVEGQFFPYVVRDVYGSKVLPENLGSITPETWHTYKARQPKDLVRAARANLVVRDGFASFYFHPFLDLEYLKRTVEGIEAAGYEFVDPASL
jgi:uncharacterized protein YdaL